MSGIVGTSHSKSKVIGRSQDTAKVWINFNGSGDVIRDSVGVASVGYGGTGEYDINLLGRMEVAPNAVAVGGCDPVSASTDYTVGAMSLIMRPNAEGGGIKCRTADWDSNIKSGVWNDYFHIYIAVFGD